MTNILVLGATGFIGRNMVEFLVKNKDYRIFAVYNKRKPFINKKVKWLKCDLRINSIDQIFKKIDIVIQGAATTSGAKIIKKKPYLHVTDNAIMNSRILRSLLNSNIKHFIFFSCTVMYQSSNRALKETDFKESDEIYPNYFGVGWTKVYIEKMCKFYSSICKTKFTVIRHSNIYGPYDKFDLEKSHVFGATVTKVMRAKKNLEVWGRGLEGRDFLYIDDLCKFVSKAIRYQKTKYEIFNVGYGKAIKIKDLVKLIIANSNKKLSINFNINRPSINTSVHLNCSKAKQMLKWTPSTDINSGINKTIRWWKANIK